MLEGDYKPPPAFSSNRTKVSQDPSALAADGTVN